MDHNLEAFEYARYQLDKLGQSDLRKAVFKETICSISYATVGFWEELVPRFSEIGRHDLVEVIQAKLAEYDLYEKRKHKKSFKQKVAWLDDRLLGGQLRKIYGKFRNDRCNASA